MTETNTDSFIKAIELRLLRSTLSPAATTTTTTPSPPPPPPPAATPAISLRPLIDSLVASIERGNYAEALSSDAAQHIVFGFAESWEFADTVDCADRFYAEAERRVSAFLLGSGVHGAAAPWLQVLCSNGEEEGGGEEDDVACRCVLVMCVAVAALLAFVQRNMTGPTGDFSAFPLRSPQLGLNKAINDGGNWDFWARGQLASLGSDLLGKFPLLQFIVYAKLLLSKIRNLRYEEKNSCPSGIESVSWWLCRLTLLHQRILDERSSSLYDALEVFMSETLNQFGSFETVRSYWGSQLSEEEALAFVSMAHLEAGIVGHVYSRVDSSRVHFKSAEEASKLHLSVTGVLGFRTVHQVDPKAQMVLVADTEQEKNGDSHPIEHFELTKESHTGAYQQASQSHANDGYCDILMTPRLVDNGNDPGVNGKANPKTGSEKVSLTAVQQAVILAQCLHIKRGNPDDELSRWEMAPFIEAIDTQQQSYFIIRCFCDILRIRWETTRSRTKQRALLMMNKLVECVFEAFPGAMQRVPLSFVVYTPTIPALRKEYGELLVGSGMVGEALKIFEDLELWDNLIYCYQLLGKKSAAVDLIKARLTDMPNDPRLWCSLGDVTNTDAYYEKALEVSNDRSARAKRSLARNAYNRGDYVTSKVLWEAAMALNSLYPDGWFALGAAALKARDVDKALDGFTRAVQLDPENGEAWNNIACLHMIKKKSKESFIAFKEALKFRRTSWQLWENYREVAMDVGDLRQALEATKMVLDLSANKRIDAKLLDMVMLKIEERTKRPCTSSVGSGDHSCTKLAGESGYQEPDMERSRETDILVDMIGKILQQIIQSGGREDIWGLYARWHKIKGNLTMCSEALLKQVRSLQGSELWHDQNRFKKFARASLQLCKVYMDIASSNGSRELITAEMHLRNTIKQAVNFSDTDEFRDLEACLEEMKNQLAL